MRNLNIANNRKLRATLLRSALSAPLFLALPTIAAEQGDLQKAAPATIDTVVDNRQVAANDQVAANTQVAAVDQTLTDRIETVTVEARKYQEDSQKVPVAITVLGGTGIQEKNITSFQQIQNQLPALSYATGNNKQTNIGLRGIGNNGSNQDGLDPSVGILVDGVYQPRLGYVTNEFVDLEQIELLRGPQGTLFGKNTTAGVILINTQKPSFNWSETGEVVGGNYGTQQYKLNLTGPITDDLAFRLTAYDDAAAGWVKSVQDNTHYLARNSKGVRGQLLYAPTEDLSIRVIVSDDWQNFHTGGQVFAGYYPVAGAGNVVTLAQANGLPYPTRTKSYFATYTQLQNTISHTEEASVHVDWDTPYGTLSDITAWTHWYFLPNNNGGQPFLTYNAFGTNNQVDSASEELRWISPRGKDVEWQAGLYYYDMSLGATNRQVLGPQYVLGSGGTPTAAGITQAQAGGLTTGYRYTIYDGSYAGYAAGTWHIDDQWDFNGGLRYTLEKKSWNYNGYVLANPGGATDAQISTIASGLVVPGAATVADDSLGYQVGTSYQLTSDILGYINYSKAEKSSGINQNPLSAAKISAGASQVLLPEKADDLEAGIKTQWLDHRLQLNGTVYDELIRNYQATGVYYVPGTTQTQSYLTNVGAIRSKGFEIDDVIVPLEGLNLSGSFAYNYANYASYHSASCPASSTAKVCDFTGLPVAYTPRYTVQQTAEYNTPISDDLSLYGVLDGSWRSSQNLSATLDPYSQIGGYLIANAKVGVILDGRYDLSVWAYNFTNTYYFTSLAGTKATGVVTGQPGEPLSFGATLRVSL